MKYDITSSVLWYDSIEEALLIVVIYRNENSVWRLKAENLQAVFENDMRRNIKLMI